MFFNFIWIFMLNMFIYIRIVYWKHLPCFSLKASALYQADDKAFAWRLGWEQDVPDIVL